MKCKKCNSRNWEIKKTFSDYGSLPTVGYYFRCINCGEASGTSFSYEKAKEQAEKYMLTNEDLNKDIYCGGKETEGKEPYDMIPEICVREILCKGYCYSWVDIYDKTKKDSKIESFKQILEVLKFGAKKYGRDSWKFVDDAQEKYSAAFLRHMQHDFNDIDEESGLPHGWHALCNCIFLLWFEIQSSD